MKINLSFAARGHSTSNTGLERIICVHYFSAGALFRQHQEMSMSLRNLKVLIALLLTRRLSVQDRTLTTTDRT